MKIMKLHNDYLETGGEFFSVRIEAAALNAAGIECDLISTSNEDFRGIRGGVRAARAALQRKEAYRFTAEAIRRVNPDVIHVHNLFPRLGAGALAAIKDSGIPWVRTLHNYRLRCLAGTCFRDGKDCRSCLSAAKGFPGVFHHCYRNSVPASATALAYARAEFNEDSLTPRAFIVVSDAMVDVFGGLLSGAPVHVHSDSVPLPGAFLESGFRQPAVGFVGRLTREKGVYLLPQVATQLPNVRVHVVGSGPLRGEIEEAANSLDNLVVHGELSHSDLAEIVSSWSMQLVPSTWAEPFGRVAVEALALGVPPIVSDRGGLPGIAAKVDERLVVSSFLSEDWVTAIDRILKLGDPEFADLRSKCRKAWFEHFSPNAAASRLKQIYGWVLDAK